MRIVPFETRDEDEVVALIVGVQRGEFGIDISAEDQPDLRQIDAFYRTGGGNFWVARVEDRVVGTIALLDIGNGQAALRKMFVQREHRGAGRGVAQGLLATLLAWAAERGLREIYLGTTPQFLAAHRFYEKNGFTQLPKAELPAAFPIMEVDTRFYTRRIAGPADATGREGGRALLPGDPPTTRGETHGASHLSRRIGAALGGLRGLLLLPARLPGRGGGGHRCQHHGHH